MTKYFCFLIRFLKEMCAVAFGPDDSLCHSDLALMSNLFWETSVKQESLEEYPSNLGRTSDGGLFLTQVKGRNAQLDRQLGLTKSQIHFGDIPGDISEKSLTHPDTFRVIVL